MSFSGYSGTATSDFCRGHRPEHQGSRSCGMTVCFRKKRPGKVEPTPPTPKDVENHFCSRLRQTFSGRAGESFSLLP